MRYLVIKARPISLALCGLMLCMGVIWFARVNNTAPPVLEQPQRSYPIYSVDTPEQKAALGINCAWDNTDVEELIRVLDEKNVKATFFVSGSWCNKYPESVQALYDAGHEIGSHSNTHADMTRLGEAEILEQIRMCSDKIEKITGERPRLFRTPSGAYNDLVIDLIRQEGLEPIQWDCDSVDYKEQTPAQMEQRVMGKLKNGSILLFHSGGKNTAQALPQIIDAMQAQGYELVPVSELIYQAPYTIDHEGRQHRAEEL